MTKWSLPCASVFSVDLLSSAAVFGCKENHASRNGSSPAPLVCSLLPMCRDLLGLTQHGQAGGIFLDPIDNSVEICSFAVRREDILVEEVTHTALRNPRQAQYEVVRRLWIIERTVNTRPTTTIPKLKDCWVARDAFSATDSSRQGTTPSSLKGVTAARKTMG